MDRIPIQVVWYVVIGIIIGGCQNPINQPSLNSTMYTAPIRTVEDLTIHEKKAIHANNVFGLKLFLELMKQQKDGENLFLSPLSISYALAMVENGAVNETLDSMMYALQQQGLVLGDITKAYANLIHILTHTDSSVEFSIANSLWLRKGKELRPFFLDVCRNYFRSQVRTMDWQELGAVDTVNTWVRDNTNNKIKEIIRDPIPQSLALLLLNAIYFKGDWTIPFDIAATDTVDFLLSGTRIKPWPMMYKSSLADTTIQYMKTDLYDLVTIPYGNGKFQMSLFLPSSNHSFHDVLVSLLDFNWQQSLHGNKSETFQILLPKLKFSYEVDLRTVLSRMGMGRAFHSEDADFSAMFVDTYGWIDRIKHKTFVQIDEVGTEAAAVTVVCMYDSAPITISFDRPFLFIINETMSQTVLFVGKIVNPLWE